MSSREPTPPVCAVLVGAGGRMGRAILGVAAQFPALAFVGAITSRHSRLLGQDSGVVAGGAPNHLPLTGSLEAALPRAQVVIDFSAAPATGENLRACGLARKPLLLGTTGFPSTLEPEFAAAARQIPLLIAPNTSPGVTLLTELTRIAARALPGFEAGITETHHREKRDAPSGTALALAAAAGGETAIESVREGEVIGEHTVRFAAPGEELVLTHRALRRDIFARGALAAALWLWSQPAGRYQMRDVMGFKTVT
ncbi:MAG: 4-hydroxy-tetrahydrodipicolinate reductase [Steroidobacteraceae bacterium]